MVKINADRIELFKNLAELEISGKYFDFHNNYQCKMLSYNKNGLELLLEHNTDFDTQVKLRFTNVQIANFSFPFNEDKSIKTIDNLYKGRFETNEKLEEFDLQLRSYFYLEFCEGQALEFFCEAIEIS